MHEMKKEKKKPEEVQLVLLTVRMREGGVDDNKKIKGENAGSFAFDE